MSNYMVLDTETLTADQLMLNLAYRVVNSQNEIIAVKDYLVSDYYNNKLFVKYAQFASDDKNGKYADLLRAKQIKKHSLKKTLALFEADVKKYDIKYIYAYNATFDYNVIEKEAERIGKSGIWTRLNVQVRDIWGFADKVICHTSDYIEWAKANEVFTPTGRYISTSVESVARYLYNNMEFEESHTAADDTRHELAILQTCFDNNANVFEDTKPEKIPSNKVFTDTFVDVDGSEISFDYKYKYTRNGITTYKR